MTIATAYRRRGSYELWRGSLRSRLYGIAANVVRGHWRDEQQLLELDARLGPAGPEAAFADAADDRVITAALAPRIAAALAELNPDQRDVLLPYAWDGGQTWQPVRFAIPANVPSGMETTCDDIGEIQCPQADACIATGVYNQWSMSSVPVYTLHG